MDINKQKQVPKVSMQHMSTGEHEEPLSHTLHLQQKQLDVLRLPQEQTHASKMPCDEREKRTWGKQNIRNINLSLFIVKSLLALTTSQLCCVQKTCSKLQKQRTILETTKCGFG